MQIYKLFYSNDDVKYASIFQPNLVEKNKHKYKIIYNNKIYNLQNISKIIGDKNEKLKIKLICYEIYFIICQIMNIMTLKNLKKI